MAKRPYLKLNTKRSLCASDLDRLITLHNRNIKTPLNFGQTEATEDFTGAQDVEAKVETRTGVTIFDGSNVETIITHQFFIRYRPNTRYRIVYVDDLNEEHEWLRFDCCVRGTSANEANSV
jgi:hypothetical protein